MSSTAWLSQCNGVGGNWVFKSSLSKLRTHMMSIVAIPDAYSSLSHVDWAVDFCLRETDRIGVAFNKMVYPDVDLYPASRLPQSASTKA